MKSVPYLIVCFIFTKHIGLLTRPYLKESMLLFAVLQMRRRYAQSVTRFLK